jgi:KipI family sensor histidine kinase inhibitor
VRLEVDYSGPDLARVADQWGCTTQEVIELHTSLEFTSTFCGFAPGFAYLAGLPLERAVPRLASPRTRVPPGSVALADTWCGVYPSASPGGWLLIGTTDARLWDVDRPQPALLAPGTRVRFEVAG